MKRPSLRTLAADPKDDDDQEMKLSRLLAAACLVTASRACWLDLFGEQIGGRYGNITSALDDAMCRASRTIGGAQSLAHDALARCDPGLRVVVFGGSVSCGHSLKKRSSGGELARDALCPQLPRMHECKREAWPALWARAMNDRFACPAGGGGEHVVTNLCRAAAGTNYIVNRVAELQSGANASDPERRALLDADVVVVETAANDVHELLKARTPAWLDADDEGQKTRAFTEILARQLLSLPRRPTLLWLTAAWRALDAPPYHRDADAEHRRVLRYYNISQVSMLAAFAPLASAERRAWARSVYFHDCCHPSALGHKYIASALVFNQERDRAAPRRDDGARPRGALPPELVISPEVSARFVRPRAVERLDLRAPAAVRRAQVAKSGFACYADVPTKPGAIADQVGAFLTLNIELPGGADAAPLDGVTSLGYLSSYEHVGSFDAEIISAPGDCRFPIGAATLARRRIDCRIDEHVSIYSSAELSWSAAPGSECVWLRVTVVESPTPRNENKVKLFDVTTYVLN